MLKKKPSKKSGDTPEESVQPAKPSLNGHKVLGGDGDSANTSKNNEAAETPSGAKPSPKIESTPVKAPQAAAKREIPGTLNDVLDESLDLPNGYGNDAMVLMVRDPWWIFAYWELEQSKRGEALGRMGQGHRSVLRLHDVTARDMDVNGSNHFQDFDCHLDTMSFYLKVNEPDRDYLVELGLLDNEGRFYRLLRSNAVRTPREQPSPEWGAEWASFVDESFEELFRLSGGGISQKGHSSDRLSSENLMRGRDKK